MIQKTKQMDSIAAVKIGQVDGMGNMVADILATGNEYVIYEIKTTDPEKRLRVFIDGHTDESEEKISQRYNRVKSNYVLAKGLLYRSSNFNLMKNRVAHALATALSNNAEAANEQFIALIAEINKEYTALIWRRVTYLAPSYIFLVICIVFSIILILYPNVIQYTLLRNILFVTTAAVIGGVFSITYSLRKVAFESELNQSIFILLGLERILLSILAGIIAFIGIKSNFIFGFLNESNISFYSILFICIVAGFSENFLPSLLYKFSDHK